MNEREKQILYTIISHYIKTGESVGSRTIEKKYDIGVSSATIRNAMADLEDKGFIHKMHTSSGRVPTKEGYKVYIDELMENLEENFSENINSYVEVKSKQIGLILENVTELLARVSKLASISLEPSVEDHKIKKIELVHINDKRAYVVAVTDLEIIKTANLNLFNLTNEKVLEEVTEYINDLIQNKGYVYTLKDIKAFLEKVGELDGGFSNKNTCKLRMSNESNLLLYSENLVKTINFLEDKEKLKELFKKLVDNENFKPYEINVLFGKDLELEEFENYAIMFSIYEYEGERGVISIIGPHRMEYKENIKLFNYTLDILKQALNNIGSLKLLS